MPGSCIGYLFSDGSALEDEAEPSNNIQETPPEGIPNIRDTLVFKMMKDRCLTSFKAYVKTFEDFAIKYNITQDCPPTLEQLEVNQSEIDKKYSILKSFNHNGFSF